MEFQVSYRSGLEPPLGFIEVVLVDIDANNPRSSGAVDLFQTVAACYAKYCNALRTTIIKRPFEQFSQRG